MSVSVEVGDGKVPAGSLPVPAYEASRTFAARPRQRMGSRDASTVWPSVPWAFGKDLTGVSPLPQSPMSSLGLEKARQGDPGRAPALLLLRLSDVDHPS